MQLHLNIIGILLVVLGLVHTVFPRYFNWKTELISLSLINRQIMHIHTLFIALTVLMMGLLCLSSADALVSTELGRTVCFGLGIFWSVRLLVQFFGYSSELWRKKRLETGIHILFVCMWSYFMIIFFMTALE